MTYRINVKTQDDCHPWIDREVPRPMSKEGRRMWGDNKEAIRSTQTKKALVVEISRLSTYCNISPIALRSQLQSLS